MMIRLNSLFWRFFVAIFIANILVMAITSYITIEASEEILSDENHEQLVRNSASFLIDRYENQTLNDRSWAEAVRLRDEQREGRDKPPRRLRLAIYTEHGERIYGRIKGDHNHAIHINYASPTTGKRYRVVALKPKLPHRLGLFLGLIQSIRFALLLIASAVVSFVLSLLITRPLKRLGEYTEQLAQGHLNVAAPTVLLARGDEVGDLARQLNDMGEKLDALVNSKQQLLHDVSHELRAPLARLQAASALLDTKDQKYVARIERECERMNALIQNILDYARLGEPDWVPTPFNVSERIAQCVQDIQFEYSSHAIQFFQPSKPVVINADEHKVLSAIDNIVRNACKYTEQGTRVDVSLEQQMSNCVITIRDHGKGVADAELDKLSKPFYRAHNRMHGEGFGLGLSIAQRAVEQHGGEMQLNNHPDGGLQVRLVLPFSD